MISRGMHLGGAIAIRGRGVVRVGRGRGARRWLCALNSARGKEMETVELRVYAADLAGLRVSRGPCRKEAGGRQTSSLEGATMMTYSETKDMTAVARWHGSIAAQGAENQAVRSSHGSDAPIVPQVMVRRVPFHFFNTKQT